MPLLQIPTAQFLGPGQTSNFSCAESNVNNLKLRGGICQNLSLLNILDENH